MSIFHVCGCGAIVERTPCPDCRRRKNRERGPGWQRYGSAYRRNRAEAIRRHPYCAECGTRERLTADHVVPKSRGGSDRPENLRVLCLTCNSSKGAT